MGISHKAYVVYGWKITYDEAKKIIEYFHSKQSKNNEIFKFEIEFEDNRYKISPYLSIRAYRPYCDCEFNKMRYYLVVKEINSFYNGEGSYLSGFQHPPLEEMDDFYKIYEVIFTSNAWEMHVVHDKLKNEMSLCNIKIFAENDIS